VEIADVFPVAGDFSLRRFAGWTDGEERTRRVVAGEEAATFTARYSIQYTIAARWVGKGRLDVSPSPPDGFFDRDSLVELSAAPEEGNEFVGWDRDLGGSEPRRTVVMRESLDVLGFFWPTAAVSNFGAMNAARQRPNTETTGTSIFAKISPGEVIVVNKPGIGPDTPAVAVPSDNGTIAAVLSETRVRVEGVSLPVLAVEKGKVTAFLPYGSSVLTGRAVRLQVEYAGTLTEPGIMMMSAANPGIYTADGSGSGLAKVVNEDGSANGPESPAAKGSVVTFYATGLGVTGSPASDNRVSPVAGPGPRGEVEVRIGGTVATVISSAVMPNELGITRVEVRVPDGARSGPATPLIITVDGAPSQYNVTIAVR
jgi:uncharacterized protein (TIGR03437 family)